MKWHVPNRYKSVKAPTGKQILGLAVGLAVLFVVRAEFGATVGTFVFVGLLMIFAWAKERFTKK